jgi:hypothetical protein
MQYVIGILIGFAVYSYWPESVNAVAKETQNIVHKTAAKVADKTEPTLYEQVKDLVK